MKSKVIKEALSAFSEIEKAEFLPKFFQAYPGGYGEGDKFLGVRVPNQRKIASKHYKDFPLSELSKVIEDQYHEMRLTGFFMLVYKYIKQCI